MGMFICMYNIPGEHSWEFWFVSSVWKNLFVSFVLAPTTIICTHKCAPKRVSLHTKFICESSVSHTQFMSVKYLNPICTSFHATNKLFSRLVLKQCRWPSDKDADSHLHDGYHEQCSQMRPTLKNVDIDESHYQHHHSKGASLLPRQIKHLKVRKVWIHWSHKHIFFWRIEVDVAGLHESLYARHTWDGRSRHFVCRISKIVLLFQKQCWCILQNCSTPTPAPTLI
jgi:hypothetical protein